MRKLKNLSQIRDEDVRQKGAYQTGGMQKLVVMMCVVSGLCAGLRKLEMKFEEQTEKYFWRDL